MTYNIKKQGSALFGTLLFCFLTAPSLKAEGKDKEQEIGSSKLEAFQRRAGVVVVKGYSRIGSVEGTGGKVHVNAIEYIDTGTGEIERGVEFFITAESGSNSQIDYDEVDSLVKALERLARLDNTVTGLAKYEATYRTRDKTTISLKETPFSKDMNVVIDGHTVTGGIVVLSRNSLNELKRLVTEAKAKLDSLKAPAR